MLKESILCADCSVRYHGYIIKLKDSFVEIQISSALRSLNINVRVK